MSKCKYPQYSFTPGGDFHLSISRTAGDRRKSKHLTFEFELLYFMDSSVVKEEPLFYQQKNISTTLDGSEDEGSY